LVSTGFADIAVFSASAVLIQPDGKIVTAGAFANCEGGCTFNFQLTRYNPDGTLDVSFGNQGITGGPCGGTKAIAIQTDGKILAAGRAFCTGENFALVRYNTDGSPDITFGRHGVALTGITPNVDEARGVAIQTDGKIVAAGGGAIFGPHPKVAITRYLAT
jgi:uncharacterized delta-60 repeat protein